MDGGKAGDGNQEQQINQSSNVLEAGDENPSDQGEVMYEEDVLEVVEDDASPENGLRGEMEDLDMEEEEESEQRDRGDGGFVPVREDAVQCFKGHTGSVFCVSLHPSGELACSGGEDDKACVWKITDGSTLFVCRDHKDSVTCTEFSHDGKYIATADMGGLVQVWLTSSGEKVWSFETEDIEWIRWHSQSHVLLAGTSDGSAWMWRIPSGDCKTFQGHNMRNTCGSLTADGRRVALGYEDSVVKVWDLKEGTPLVSVTSPLGHSDSITSLATHNDNVLLLSGSEDSTAKLTNTNTGKVLVTFSAGFAKQGVDGGAGASAGETESELSSVEAVEFSPTNPLAVTGSLSGVMGIWDIPTQKLRQKCIHKDGVVRLHCSSASPLVFTGCLDGIVRGWDLRSGHCVKEWHGHSDQILDIAVIRDDSTILSAANDGTVRVFLGTQ